MKMTEKEKAKYLENPNVIIKLKGKTFRCDCGCNVFGHPTFEKNVYSCNGCGTTFKAE